MKVYISGISGTGMGPLALMAKAAGIKVVGSDLAKGAIYSELEAAGIEIAIGPQDGKFLQAKIAEGLDWFVYTSALPKDHTELQLAKKSGLKCTKRDDFTAYLVEKLDLKMVAVAGTHGKTTTTSMLIWAATELGLPAAYIVGTTLQFAPSGAYHPHDKFFIYEADEYDRNFLKFHPWLAVIPAVSYDHPDIYPTREDYQEAFRQFRSQCENIIDSVPTGSVASQSTQNTTAKNHSSTATSKNHSATATARNHSANTTSENSRLINLAGKVRRYGANLALQAIQLMAPKIPVEKIAEILNRFPGAGRRFEQIADGIYSDYAHHPDEIIATLDIAKDEAKLKNYQGITVIYEPHQNTRQHEVLENYKDAFTAANKIYWLPTFLTRENPNLPVLAPEDFIAKLSDGSHAEPAKLSDDLFAKILAERNAKKLVILLTAGPADQWLRKNCKNYNACAIIKTYGKSKREQ